LGFILLAWGIEAVRLSAGGASLAWARLMVALPVVLPVAVLAGWLSGWSSGSALAAVVWGLAGAFFGYFSGRLPYDGLTRLAWLLEPRLSGMPLYTYGYAASVRTTLVMMAGAGFGMATGFLQAQVVQWAWQRSARGTRMSASSWLTLLACLPLALFLALVVDSQINKPLRAPLHSTIELVQIWLGPAKQREAQDNNYSALNKFAGELSDDYQVHLVGYELDSMATAYTDVVFGNGLRLRCTTVRVEDSNSTKHRIVNCVDFRQQLDEWMGDLAYAGLYGERRWLADDRQKLVVSDQALSWLRQIRQALDESQQITHIEQLGNWIFISARYGGKFEIGCRIQALVPSVIEACWPAGEPSAALALEASQHSAQLADQDGRAPGEETIPLEELSARIPWLPFQSGQTPAVSFIVFNMNYSYLKNNLVRQALAHAADRRAMIMAIQQVNGRQDQLKETFVLPDDRTGGQEAYQGWRAPNIQFYVNLMLNSAMSYQRPREATTLIPPQVLGRDLHAEIGLPYDPQLAYRLMAQAGYPGGQDFPPLRLFYVKSNMNTALMEALAKGWRQTLGVQIELLPMTLEKYLNQVESGGSYQLYFGGWAGEYYDPDYFLGVFVRTPAPGWRHQNPALLSLVEAAAGIRDDPAARQALYIQAEQLLSEDEVLLIPLIHHTIDQRPGG
jgi:hypothetical protein